MCTHRFDSRTASRIYNVITFSEKHYQLVPVFLIRIFTINEQLRHSIQNKKPLISMDIDFHITTCLNNTFSILVHMIEFLSMAWIRFKS